jgi:hypothetical protein
VIQHTLNTRHTPWISRMMMWIWGHLRARRRGGGEVRRGGARWVDAHVHLHCPQGIARATHTLRWFCFVPCALGRVREAAGHPPPRGQPAQHQPAGGVRHNRGRRRQRGRGHGGGHPIPPSRCRHRCAAQMRSGRPPPLPPQRTLQPPTYPPTRAQTPAPRRRAGSRPPPGQRLQPRLRCTLSARPNLLFTASSSA